MLLKTGTDHPLAHRVAVLTIETSRQYNKREKNGTDEIVCKNRDRDTNIGKKCKDTKPGEGVGANWVTGIDIYTLLILHVRELTRTYYKHRGTLLSSL